MSEWISAEEKLPSIFAGVFQVRLANGAEVKAFFYQDAIAWAAFYGHKTGHWWTDDGDHERLDNVTHWKNHEKKEM